MRIAIYGTGAIGGYFGYRLVEAGEEVYFISRGQGLRALTTRGLVIEHPDGTSSTLAVQAFEEPSLIGEVDAIILGVKAWQVPEAAHGMRPLIGKETFVVPLQNGVEAPAQLARFLGSDHVFGGLCRISCKIVAPGRIRHEGLEPYVAFGELDNRASDRAQQLLEAFRRAGVNAEVPPDIQESMWRKFLLISAWSGLASVTRVPVGILRSVPETRELLRESLKEVVGVGRDKGINLDENDAITTLDFIDRAPAAATTS
ncbi:MAG: 2-dehydropantoate 2-reductase, partial [Desulfomonile sp.]|nr:2-dehydropantoate 2-reductase [Desulfomonile sp.]